MAIVISRQKSQLGIGRLFEQAFEPIQGGTQRLAVRAESAPTEVEHVATQDDVLAGRLTVLDQLRTESHGIAPRTK
jgi:hypothetical protein